MSTYDDSSLFLYPSGYKASVLFAQKPMDANGQLAFARSNDTATRVASNGLIEKVRTNLATYSEQFNNAAWSKQEITVTANAAVAPDGTQSADKLIPTAVTSTHQITSATLTTLTQCAFSVFAKADGYNTITILDLSVASNGATFNVATGTVSTIFGTATASIVPYGNGWYRCIVVANTTGVRFYVPTSASNFTGDGTSGVLLWGAQVEAGDIATDYIATTTTAVSVGPLANIPRIDYLGGGCGKLLLEPQRTNLVTFSEQIDNAAWSKTASVVTANVSVSPDGYQNADRLTDTNVLSGHVVQQFALNVASSAIVSASVYLKKDVSRYAGFRLFVPTNGTDVGRFSIVVDLETGAVTSTLTSGAAIANLSYSVVNAGNGWYRAIISGTSPVGNCGLMVWLTPSATPTNDGFATTAFTGNGQSVFCWGAQFEVGSYATSYIPTLAASVTRGADACSKTGISSLIGQTEGTLFVEFENNANFNSNIDRIISISDGTSSNRLYLAKLSSGASYFVAVSGGTQTGEITGSAIPTGNVKIAVAYKTNDCIIYINGAAAGTDTSVTIPACSQLFLGRENGVTTDGLFKPYKQALLFKTRLSNADLAALTA